MKSKMYIMGAFFVILMFLSLNMAWAHDSTSRDKVYKSQGYSSRHRGGHLNYGFIPLTKEQKRFERAKRKAWADGRLTYQEMRMLHKLEKNARRHIHRSKHQRVPYHHKKRSYISHGHKWYGFPRFSIMFSFSEPKSHKAGAFGVR
jgi:hypothetical protein